MSLAEGTRLGPYEILSAIGAGGMGEVYKATDTRLNRTVALKILPAHVSGEEEMRARFEREAQTIAGLNHPNICTLHDVGHLAPSTQHQAPAPSTEHPAPSTSPVSFLVLEYLEGETLADRLARGAMPLAEALKAAVAIADALDRAHREGIIHRDLKPANVMLTRAGPKLLDFGLAKWAAGDQESLGAMPTRADVTAKGTMLGTLQYMAPEQIEGKEADARTDIFAFGTLVYEMVTGRKSFEGKTQATLISAIMSREPRPMSHLVPVSPAALEHVVERCLAKDPDERWQSAHSLVVQLRWIAYGDARGGVTAPVTAEERRRDRIVFIALAAAAALAVALTVPAFLYFRGPAPGEPFRYRVPVRGFQDAALAPDGSGYVFTARPSEGASALYYRPLGAISAVRFDGTTDAAQPFWSPDSRFVGFVTGNALRKIDVTGGPAQTLAQVSGFTGGTWNSDNVILFGTDKGLFRVSAEGGPVEPVTTVEAPAIGHYWPHFLPDGRQYVFLAWAAEPGDRALFMGSLGSSEHTRLLAVESNAAFASSSGPGRTGPGHLVYHREAAVYAQPFDPGSRSLTGEPVRLAGGVTFDPATGRSDFGVSHTGTLLYFEGILAGAATGRGRGGRGENPSGQFSWVDRNGRILQPAGESGPYGDMDLSPDGTKIAVTRVDSGAGDVWVIDWQRGQQGVPTRLTLDPADDYNPVWSPDGTRVAFTTTRNGNPDIYVINANGVGDPEPLLSSPEPESVEAWSRDGKYLAYLAGPEAQANIHVLPLDGDRKPLPLVVGPYRTDEAQFSYDGRWLAYASDESGTFEVYVMSFPDGAQREKASVGGGGQPRWSPDGKELFYRTPDGRAMAVAVTSSPALAVGSPRDLFNMPFQPAYSNSPTRHQWAVSPDGQRFLARAPHAVAASARGSAGGGVATVPQSFTPVGASAGAAPAPGRVAATADFGLTILLDWTAILRGERR